jgi:hypothetical protein
MDKSHKMEEILGRDGPSGFCGKKVLNRQIFIVGYLKFVERKPLHAALCSAGHGASTVGRELHRRLSVIATPRKNGSVKPSGSSQGSDSDVIC